MKSTIRQGILGIRCNINIKPLGRSKDKCKNAEIHWNQIAKKVKQIGVYLIQSVKSEVEKLL